MDWSIRNLAERNVFFNQKAQVGTDQENVLSEKVPHSKN